VTEIKEREGGKGKEKGKEGKRRKREEGREKFRGVAICP